MGLRQQPDTRRIVVREEIEFIMDSEGFQSFGNRMLSIHDLRCDVQLRGMCTEAASHKRDETRIVGKGVGCIMDADQRAAVLHKLRNRVYIRAEPLLAGRVENESVVVCQAAGSQGGVVSGKRIPATRMIDTGDRDIQTQALKQAAQDRLNRLKAMIGRGASANDKRFLRHDCFPF